MTLQQVLAINGKKCSCGKVHSFPTDKIYCEKDAVNRLPQLISAFSCKKAFILSDKNTYKAAGDKVVNVLKNSNIDFTSYIFDCEKPIPNEEYVGSAVMHFDHSCDIIIGVGSGVINDIGKIISKTSSKPYIIVGTAPSMDGYASDSSSMERDGLKISLPSKCPDAIIGDTNILCKAPEKMLSAGLGDIIAKYTSLAEWRISSLLNGEYYCEEMSRIIRGCLEDCTTNAKGLMNRDEKAVASVFEGLVITGIAMAYAGCTRPASGMEHYISHVWDMRGLAMGTTVDLHGTQVAIGTYITANLFDKLKNITPDKNKAISFVNGFDFAKYSEFLVDLIGNGAKKMIELEAKEQKYNKDKHQSRLDKIVTNWDEIIRISNEEIPSIECLDTIFKIAKLPKKPSEIGIDDNIIFDTVKATKDIRDKYVLSRLSWDLGIDNQLLN